MAGEFFILKYVAREIPVFSMTSLTAAPWLISSPTLARYAGMALVKYIPRIPEERRLAVLTEFVKAQEISALDEAVDVLDMLILDITRSAKNTGQKKRLRPLKNLDRAALLLAWTCTLLLDGNTDEAALRQAIFRRIPKDKLAESVSKVNGLARPQDTHFQGEMVEQYGRVKRFMSAMLRD